MVGKLTVVSLRPLNLKVVDTSNLGANEPVTGSGSDPTCMALVL
jgi:hypothetical protein